MNIFYAIFLMLFNMYFLVSADAEPGTWTPWVDNGCTDTCGMCGVVQQIRECLVPGTCTGSSIQNTTLSCTSNVCFFPRPACCPGYKRGFVDGQITCILFTNGPPDNNEPKSLGTWSQWIESGCTDTCGLCGVTRMKRDCLGPGPCNGTSNQTTNTSCGDKPCYFPRRACCVGKRSIKNRAFVCAL